MTFVIGIKNFFSKIIQTFPPQNFFVSPLISLFINIFSFNTLQNTGLFSDQPCK